MGHVDGTDDGVGYGVKGENTDNPPPGHMIVGVWGDAPRGVGVNGTSIESNGVGGSSKSGAGVLGESTTGSGVQGFSTSGDGVYGTGGTNGVRGETKSDANVGVWARNFGAGKGLVAESVHGIGLQASGNPVAAQFLGNVEVTGTLAVKPFGDLAAVIQGLLQNIDSLQQQIVSIQQQAVSVAAINALQQEVNNLQAQIGSLATQFATYVASHP